MNENTRIYTQNELYENEINTDDYKLNSESGEFEGTLKIKAWTSKSRMKGNGKAIRAFIELEDGRKIIALVQPFRSEQIALISAAEIGELLKLRFETSSSGLVYLAELKVLDMPEEIL
ncbi:MAG: hypothetical protein J6W36_02940 [Clostridiales bacterium]|nr:hypothetical protein [Clostridiales bacterium]